MRGIVAGGKEADVTPQAGGTGLDGSPGDTVQQGLVVGDFQRGETLDTDVRRGERESGAAVTACQGDRRIGGGFRIDRCGALGRDGHM